MTETEPNLIEKLDWKKMGGLIPVVVQDADSKEALMLAYANKEALEKTLKTGFGTYWSRSRQKLWMKGETSGNTQKIVRVVADCDYDTLLYVVKQKGPVCHTGAETCFHHEFKV
ncbi:MAG: phosphoribosyl-AMP cyclohydrolase [Candidatus Bathyarchaeota archaeon]|nr:phosphoribosyl-AMP cyclohydrolase [Candidatus Bathyarchaeota archaeon]